MTKVYIVESESGWGSRIDETMEFDTKEEAITYCKDYNNRHNTADSVPSWYMYATLA